MIDAPTTRCPTCGKESSENYDGTGTCWPCHSEKLPTPATNGHRQKTTQASAVSQPSYQVTFDGKGKPQLPPLPAHDDQLGLCSWVTAVFNLDTGRPITSGVREGLRGPDGHVKLDRRNAPALRFEPAARINQPARLIETLSWQTLPTDGAVHALTAAHCREISYVVRMLCGISHTITEAQEAEGIVSDFLSAAERIEGCTTYGTQAQRFEAAISLRRAIDEVTGRKLGVARYLVDGDTGEIVMAVGDLQETARRHVGSTLPRGWLDGRMADLGWTRITLDGHLEPGRSGRRTAHARIFAYRGHLPGRDDQEAVTT